MIKNIKITILVSISIVLMAFCVSGCSTVQKIPIKLDPNFSNKGIDTIVLMPVVDRRPEKSAKLNFENEILLPSKKILEAKGYTVVMPDKYSKDSNISSDQVAEMTTEELSALGPKGATAILFIYIEDVMDSYVVMAYTFKIEATGSLIYKQERSELWRDKGIGSYGQGGLMSGVTSGMDRGVALSQCLESMLVTLPKCAIKEKPDATLSIKKSEVTTIPEATTVNVKPAAY